MNKVILMGRLTRDPDVRYGGANNTAVARYTLAVNRKFKRDGEQDVDFINCVAFEKPESSQKNISRREPRSVLSDGSRLEATLTGMDRKSTQRISLLRSRNLQKARVLHRVNQAVQKMNCLLRLQVMDL